MDHLHAYGGAVRGTGADKIAPQAERDLRLGASLAGPSAPPPTTVPMALEHLGGAVARLEKVSAALCERLAQAGILRSSPGTTARGADRPSYGGQSELAVRIDGRTTEIDQVVTMLGELYNALDV